MPPPPPPAAAAHSCRNIQGSIATTTTSQLLCHQVVVNASHSRRTSLFRNYDRGWR